MIGPLFAAALDTVLNLREALFAAARARVQRYMVENVRCPYCLGTGLDSHAGIDTPCVHCNGTGLRQENHGP
jgi:DnaJ-class molecular chaperone